jgi:hypothetical protein
LLIGCGSSGGGGGSGNNPSGDKSDEQLAAELTADKTEITAENAKATIKLMFSVFKEAENMFSGNNMLLQQKQVLRDPIEFLQNNRSNASDQSSIFSSAQSLASSRMACSNDGYIDFEFYDYGVKETVHDCALNGNIYDGWQTSIYLDLSGEWAGYVYAMQLNTDLTVKTSDNLQRRSRGGYKYGVMSSPSPMQKMLGANVSLEYEDNVGKKESALADFTQTISYADNHSVYRGSMGYRYNGEHIAFGVRGDTQGHCATSYEIPNNGYEIASGSNGVEIKITYNNNVKVELINGSNSVIAKIFPENASATGSCSDFVDWLNN